MDGENVVCRYTKVVNSTVFVQIIDRKRGRTLVRSIICTNTVYELLCCFVVICFRRAPGSEDDDGCSGEVNGHQTKVSCSVLLLFDFV